MMTIYCMLILLSVSLADSDLHSPFYTKDNFIHDQTGRIILFRGTNFVNKQAPWYPQALLSPAHLDDLQHWGFNAIRLGMMWSGAEIREGVFNQSYYEVMKGIVNEAAERGIYALLDNHQDVMSSLFCLYDGVPLFYVNKSVVDFERAFPWPMSSKDGMCNRSWSANYITEATGKAFEDFYRNNHGLRDVFREYWEHTAEMMGDLPILGYELWNEPWAGDVFGNPLYFLPSEAGEKNLLPLYDVLVSGINKYDTKNLIFFEPVTWGMLFDNDYLGSGFSRPPTGSNGRSIFSFHYYCWFFAFPTVFEKAACDLLLGPLIFDTVQKDLKNHLQGSASFMTEWGSGPCQNCCNPHTPDGIEICHKTLQLADDHFTSWTEWDWGTGPLSENWNVDPLYVALFVRPYPQATAGTPLHFSFDSVTKKFKHCFNINTTITAPTVLYIPFDIQYNNTYQIIKDPSVNYEILSKKNQLLLHQSTHTIDQSAICTTITIEL